ncbi:MAG: hypothetical protein LBT89_02780 [Planctomycetaceae bacterium]|jgi:uncharacterized membrane protein YeaQ/YmgE (transglycosylase-associated protein family)|nr:hypothetical protein [Planctomycetaceae bacterium]
MLLSAVAQSWVNLVLIWIGFGTVTALITQLFLPGEYPKSFLGYLAIGLTGSCAGPVAFSVFAKPSLGLTAFHPLSPVGFGLAIVTAAVLLLFYRSIIYLCGVGVKSEVPQTKPKTN